MADPFESLRHDAVNKGSTAIDPRFRAEVLVEARRRLTSGASTDVVRPRVTADTPTPIPMESIPMLAKNPNKARPLLLAAACVTLVAAGIVTVVALQDDDKPPATIDTTPSPTLETAPPQTQPAAPETTAPTKTTAPGTTALAQTASSIDGDEIAEAVLLEASEYAPDWVVVRNTGLGASMHPGAAGTKAECGPFLDPVFAPTNEGSTAYRSFYHADPQAFFTQFTAVYPDAATARSVYEYINSPEFVPCATAYGTALSAGSSQSRFPSPVDQPASNAPFGTIGDALTYRTFPETWHDSGGHPHGPQTDLDAVMLVGPTITFLGTVTDGEGGAVLNTVDQFASALQRVVERTNAALAEQAVT